MINLVSRYEFDSHVMLRSLCLQLEQDGHALFRNGTFLKVFKYRVYENNENIFVSDDPLAFLAGLMLFRKVERRVFWMLELNMYQERVNNFRRFLRAMVFGITTWFSLLLASKIVFPSKLRRKFICELFRHLKIKPKSVVVPNVAKLHLSGQEVSKKIQDKVSKIALRSEKVAVYAGAMQEGRDLDQIINHASSAGISLILCGPICSAELAIRISKTGGVFYLGDLNQADLNFVYENVSVGYVNYTDFIPNTRYCAPVKIWEYKRYELYVFSNSNFAMCNEWLGFVDLFYDADFIPEAGSTNADIFADKPKASNISVSNDVLRSVTSH